MHVPSGLFVQGHYTAADFNAPGHVPNGYWGSACGTGAAACPLKKDTAHWLIQAGISKNWFGIGNTALYGEYGVITDWGAESGAGRNFATAGFTAVNGVTDTELRMWGLGITQNVDAAASTLYLSYRNSDADIRCTGAANANGACAGAAQPAGTPSKNLPTEQIHAIIGGAVVRF
jgi:hypothetical protein